MDASEKSELLAGLRTYAAILRRMAQAHEDAVVLVEEGDNVLAADRLMNFACGLPPGHDDTVVGWIGKLGGARQVYVSHLPK